MKGGGDKWQIRLEVMKYYNEGQALIFKNRNWPWLLVLFNIYFCFEAAPYVGVQYICKLMYIIKSIEKEAKSKYIRVFSPISDLWVRF